jgi:hypothetical protein
MTYELKVIHRWFVLFAVASIATLPGAAGQQAAASSHIGASASGSGSSVGMSANSRRAGSGGTSTWSAGKGNFGYSAQPGGVWRDGTALGATTSAGRGTTQSRASAPDVLSPTSGNSFGAKPTGMRGNPGAGAARVFPSPSIFRPGLTASGRGIASKQPGKSYVANRSRTRVGSLGGGAGRRPTRSSSRLTSSVAKPALTRGAAAGYSLHSGLDTNLSKRDVGPQR